MQFDKQTIIDLIKEHGDASKADQAHQELPDQVDTDQHGGQLEKFGLSADTLMKHLPGGLPGGFSL